MKLKKRDNQAFFDWYSLRHFISGFLTGLLLIALRNKFGYLEDAKMFIITGAMLMALWEVFEISLRMVKYKFKRLYKFLKRFLPEYLFVQESKMNAVSDILIGVVGILAAYWIF
jgi:hypothetical protein